ncbi:MAG: hypothetical protein JO307_29675 [Bryobacterales bacterium]|nr:hypothetical protein [Bryobacterales bacterium]MBV9399909.1 hypothetical protein [Bryobacterales bacterium]
MKSSTKKAAVLCGVAMAAGFFAFRANADEWDKKTILTVNQPIQISDTYLDPGTYVLKLDRSPSDRHIVRIYNERENHLYNTVLAYPNYRIRPTGSSQFTFYETPAGTARAMRAWFYPGDNFGQEFPYPKSLRQVAVATIAPAPAAPPAPAPQVVEQEAAPAPAPAPAVAETQRQEETQVEIAQNNSPAPPPAAPVETAPAQPETQPQVNTQPQTANTQPQELPRTASVFPLIGLAGLISFGLYGLLRAKQLS